MESSSRKFSVLRILALLCALLSGCTEYVLTHVTTFSDWHASPPITYAFVHGDEQQDTLKGQG